MLTSERNLSMPASEVALFLDLDGTLAPIASQPDLVGPDARRTTILREVGEALNGRLAVISGRPVGEVDHILDNCVPAVAGLHGLQRRSIAGALLTSEPHPEIENALPAIRAFASSEPELLIEDKKLAIAIHYRQCPGSAERVLAFARRLAWSTGLKLQEGRMVAELRSPGPHKGDMVLAFMREAPFIGHSPIFVGDDITDEDGFAAAEEMGGRGVLVGPARETHASCRLSSVDQVLSWLRHASKDGAFALNAG